MINRKINKKLDEILEILQQLIRNDSIIGKVPLEMRVCDIHNRDACQPVYDIDDEILLYHWCTICNTKYKVKKMIKNKILKTQLVDWRKLEWLQPKNFKDDNPEIIEK